MGLTSWNSRSSEGDGQIADSMKCAEWKPANAGNSSAACLVLLHFSCGPEGRARALSPLSYPD